MVQSHKQSWTPVSFCFFFFQLSSAKKEANKQTKPHNAKHMKVPGSPKGGGVKSDLSNLSLDVSKFGWRISIMGN